MSIILFETDMAEDILYSEQVRAGRRIYYFDMKKDGGGPYLSITESKRSGDGPTFERRRLFLYPEDFDKFRVALEKVMGIVQQRCCCK